MYPLAIRRAAPPAKRARPLRTVRRTAVVRYFNARGIGRNVDTYA
ncbi:MAG TPA: hypothetical protein VIO32_06785 [Candidatus Baltobacteraceae bacterium]